MVDIKLVQKKLLLLKELKEALTNYRIQSLQELRKSHQLEKATEKTLQEMIEICLDIGKHIIADEKFRIPDDSKDIFQILNEQDILSDKLLPLMINMTGFRNLIVHLYEKIDLEIVYGIYSKHLRDFDRFSEEIEKFLEKKQG